MADNSFTEELDLNTTAALSAVSAAATSGKIPCGKLEAIVCHLTYSTNTDTGDFRILLIDKQGTVLSSVPVTPGNTALAEGARYKGEGIYMPTYGAEYYQVRLDAITGGNVSVFPGAI